jgi:hypothetical protein
MLCGSCHDSHPAADNHKQLSGVCVVAFPKPEGNGNDVSQGEVECMWSKEQHQARVASGKCVQGIAQCSMNGALKAAKAQAKKDVPHADSQVLCDDCGKPYPKAVCVAKLPTLDGNGGQLDSGQSMCLWTDSQVAMEGTAQLCPFGVTTCTPPSPTPGRLRGKGVTSAVSKAKKIAKALGQQMESWHSAVKHDGVANRRVPPTSAQCDKAYAPTEMSPMGLSGCCMAGMLADLYDTYAVLFSPSSPCAASAGESHVQAIASSTMSIQHGGHKPTKCIQVGG